MASPKELPNADLLALAVVDMVLHAHENFSRPAPGSLDIFFREARLEIEKNGIMPMLREYADFVGPDAPESIRKLLA